MLIMMNMSGQNVRDEPEVQEVMSSRRLTISRNSQISNVFEEAREKEETL